MQRLTQGFSNSKRFNADRVNALRKTYESLMDEERRRKDRNEQIIGILDKMRRSNTVALRGPLTRPYDDYQLLNISPTSHISDDLRKLKFNDTNQAQPFVPAITHNINEDIILKEMSKKYIIIPKLMHANVTLQGEKGFESTSTITASYESEDWRRKYEILNQIKTNKETDDTHPYFTKAERDQTNPEDKLLLVSKCNGESKYSTVTKLVSNNELTNIIKIIAPTNSVDDLAQLRSESEEHLTKNSDAIKYESQLPPPEDESNQCEIIYANVNNANSEQKVSFDNDKPCTEHKSPDDVSMDKQKSNLRTYDDQEEEINEIESNLRFHKEHSISHNENIAPVSTLHYENNSNVPSENYDCKRESPGDLMAYEANTAEYENSKNSLTETQNIENSPNTNNEEHQNYEYQNIDVNESTHYRNSDVNHFGENENNEVQQNDNEAVENQYQNYDLQQDGTSDNYSNQYLVYGPNQTPVEQEQIDEFNEENNSMFYSENDALVYQQPEEPQLPQQQPQEFYENQYVFDNDNETMQPYDQSYEQQYSELDYDTTQESSNNLPLQGDHDETAIREFTDDFVLEMQNQFNVEQIKNELDVEEGLNVPE